MWDLTHSTKTLLLSNASEVASVKTRLHQTAVRTSEILARLAKEEAPLEALYQLKFLPVGLAPFGDVNLNVVEELNQLFTYLTTMEAVTFLLNRHPSAAPFRVNLGTRAGFDIESEVGLRVAAEVFASTRPSSNNKLNVDAKKLAITAAAYAQRYVFYHSPSAPNLREYPHGKYPTVQIVYIDYEF